MLSYGTFWVPLGDPDNFDRLTIQISLADKYHTTRDLFIEVAVRDLLELTPAEFLERVTCL